MRPLPGSTNVTNHAGMVTGIHVISAVCPLERYSPLSRFPKWASLHRHPYGKAIPPQRSVELLASLTEGARQRFFKLQGAHRVEKESSCFQKTCIYQKQEDRRQEKVWDYSRIAN